MRCSYISVDIDVYDIISDIDTEILEEELKDRADKSKDEMVLNGLQAFIENKTGHLVECMTDEEICSWALKELGRDINKMMI